MTRATLTIGATLATGLLLVATTASAGPLPRSHDGLFIRLTPGVSGAASKTESGGMDYSLSGPGGSFGLGVGFAVVPNVILGLDLSSTAVLGPTLKIDDEEFQASEDVTWGVSYAGASGTLYLAGETNLYLTGGVGALIMRLQFPGEEDSETDVGVGGRLAFGKEWWTSPNWGLGVAAELLAGSVPASGDNADDNKWSTATFNIAFSATYN